MLKSVNISYLINSLLTCSCPSAIRRSIVAIWILAVKRQPFWFFPHISKEIWKGIVPAIAHFYTASTISFKSFCIWRIASLYHVSPSVVLNSFLSSACLTMFEIYFAYTFSMKAATALYQSVSKMPSINCFVGSAGAPTNPSCHSSLRIFSPTNYYESTEKFFGKVNEFCHVFSIQQYAGVCQ